MVSTREMATARLWGRSLVGSNLNVPNTTTKYTAKATPFGPTRCHNFSTHASLRQAQNRIFDAPRTAADLSTLISLSVTASRPLLTLWTASYCPSCKLIAPLMLDILGGGKTSSSCSGESTTEKPVGYAEVEFDSPTFLSSGMADGTGAESVLAKYTITSVPTLLAFDTRGSAMLGLRMTDVNKMRNEREVRQWISEVLRRA